MPRSRILLPLAVLLVSISTLSATECVAPAESGESTDSGPGTEGTCSCNLPGHSACPSQCSSCTFVATSCFCWTGCTAGGCPSGYTEIDSVWCGIFFDEKCERYGSRQTSTCATCAAGRYGPSCLQCPSCSGHGDCQEGISGNGTCTCDPGFAGSNCQYSDAITCSGHGRVSFSGSCVCDPGYAGLSCSVCAANYYGYPTCAFCSSTITCSGHGTCSSIGSCECSPGYYGTNCIACTSPEELACGDARDDDCDSLVDCEDQDCCSDTTCTGNDADGDGYQQCDCDSADQQTWTTPGEVLDLILEPVSGGDTLLQWTAPPDPGAASILYQVLRAYSPAGFSQGDAPCIGPDPDTFALDQDPMPGTGVVYYFVRAINDCGTGSLGRTSWNVVRSGTCQ